MEQPTKISYVTLVRLPTGRAHGYAIMKSVEETSGGVVQRGPATLYGTLKRLVDAGLAEESDRRPAEDDQRRRYYRLTGLGRRVCMAEADRLETLVRRTQFNLRPGMT